MSNIVVTFIDRRLTVAFRRMKKMSGIANYFDCYNQYYVHFAAGPLDSNTGLIIKTIQTNKGLFLLY